MSKREKIIAIISFGLVLALWTGVALVMSRSSITPDRLAQLPTQAVLPTLTEPVRPEVNLLPTTVSPALRQTITQNQIIVRFAPDSSSEARENYIESLQGTIQQEIPALNTLVIAMPETTAPDALLPSLLIESTEPDYLVSAQIDVPTSDPHYADQWALPAIGAPTAWADLTPDEPMMTIAVIDSGICANHPDLQGRILPGYDFVDDDNTPQDELGHGCSVAGVIAANADNGIGIAGVAPNTSILPLRVLDASGIGTYSDVAAAIVQATDSGAAIINLSLGGPNASQLLNDALDYALERDVLVIAAAGNNGTTQVLYPAAYAPVIAVGAVNQNMERSSFSNYGPQLDILAPGEAILSLANTDDYTSLSGTSLAAPHVSAAAALEMARGNTLTLDGGILSLGASNQPVPTPPIVDVPPEYDDLLAKANQEGHVRIIARLNVAYQSEGLLTSAQVRDQRAAIAQSRNTLVTEITSNTDAHIGSRSLDWPIPYVGMSADAQALALLANSATVVDIFEDTMMQRQLARSVPFIEADKAINLGLDGTGQTIAIIDDGIDNSHPFFGGRVVEEACFSNYFEDPGFGSLCPNGLTEQYGPGSANSGPQCVPYDDPCDHGIHVAGIAAGNGGPVDAPNGVAPNASIISVQVFTGSDDCDTVTSGAQPCVGSYTFDQIDGMLHVLDLSATYNIAALNMSLGTGGLTFGSVADCLTYETNYRGDLYTATFTLLRDEGIMPIVSAGNDYDEGGTTFPACLPTAVSVGSVGAEWDPGPQTDEVSVFSNNAPYMDFFAPGGYINSSVANDLYEFFSGTSMAAPHVAGAWAVLKQANPNATLTDIMNALVNTGEPVFDDRNGINLTKPRINVYAAMLELLPAALVVNSTNDVDDTVCDATHCSLREAINTANALPTMTTVIEFNIGAGGQQTIVLDAAEGPLPIVVSPVLIDGTTQPGFSGTPLIEIDGTNLSEADPLTEFGLTLTGGSSLVRGLIINNFGSAAIHLTSGDYNVVAGNYLGTEPDGTTAAPNREGVRICSSSYNLVGGLTTADRNLIAGNSDDGINLCRYAPLAFPTGNTIQGNFVGLDVTGAALLANGDDGVKVEDSTNTLIGGLATGAGNVISGNASDGIYISGSSTTDSTIQGNFIGTNASGTLAIQNQFNGIFVHDGASNTLIGGTNAAARNVISGNGQSLVGGHDFSNGIFIDEGAHSNTILGNYLGVDVTGNAALGNGGAGILIRVNADNNTVGGDSAAERNVISGNQNGVAIAVDSENNTVSGNYIGTGVDGTTAIGNSEWGVVIQGASDNIIGGSTLGSGNIIAYSGLDGIWINDTNNAATISNLISSNRIFANTQIGIDLDKFAESEADPGVTANDAERPG